MMDRDSSNTGSDVVGGAAPTTPAVKRNERSDALVGMLIGPAFLALAAWFLMGPNLAVLPELERVSVPRSEVSADPPRQIITGIPTYTSGGYELRCMECHRLFESLPESAQRPLTQHLEIVFDHGLNNRCLNCHDNDDRNRLRLPGGKTIAFAEAPRLCGACHGPTYRDWQRGMHGRTNGYWDATRGQRRRLICTECHDPHAPALAPMVPVPGPHTLRMAATESAPHAASREKYNPLLRWHDAPEEGHAAGPGESVHGEEEDH